MKVLHFRSSPHQVHLKDTKGKKLLKKLDDHFFHTRSTSSPGNDDFVSGIVDTDKGTFIIHPFFTIRRRLVNIFCYGRIIEKENRDYLEIRFGSSVISIIISQAFLLLCLYTFVSILTERYLFIVVVLFAIQLPVNYILLRNQFRKQCKRHFDFLKNFIAPN